MLVRKLTTRIISPNAPRQVELCFRLMISHIDVNSGSRDPFENVFVGASVSDQ